MAIIASNRRSDTAATVAYEFFTVTGEGGDTNFTIDPTEIEAILGVCIMPNNAAAATAVGAGTMRLNGVVAGAATFNVLVPASCNWIITVWGVVA